MLVIAQKQPGSSTIHPFRSMLPCVAQRLLVNRCPLGTKLPGLDTNYLKQESTYTATAKVGDELTARTEITRIRPEKHLVDLESSCRNEAGRLVCHGRALVHVNDVCD